MHSRDALGCRDQVNPLNLIGGGSLASLEIPLEAEIKGTRSVTLRTESLKVGDAFGCHVLT